jgi:hypothetical protein
MIVRGITPTGETVYLEVEVHTLARRLLLHVQTRGREWMCIVLDMQGLQSLVSILNLQGAELARWRRSATSLTDVEAAFEVVRGLRDAGIHRPELPPAPARETPLLDEDDER